MIIYRDSYHSGKRREFMKPPEDGERFYMGVEIEHSFYLEDEEHDYIEVDNASRLIPGDTIFGYEKDGSLDDGWELITQPLPESRIEEMLKEPISEYLSIQVDNYGASLNNAGMHVHVSNNVYTLACTHILEQLLRSGEFFSLLKKVSHRGTGQYCGGLDGDCDDHYRYINCSHSRTIEWRLFKSRKTWDGVALCVQTVRALYDYVWDTAQLFVESDLTELRVEHPEDSVCELMNRLQYSAIMSFPFRYFSCFIRNNSSKYDKLDDFMARHDFHENITVRSKSRNQIDSYEKCYI